MVFRKQNGSREEKETFIMKIKTIADRNLEKALEERGLKKGDKDCKWCSGKGFNWRAYEGRDKKVPCSRCCKK